jgi:orotidine-5'-phosphate decarboxylase
MPRAHQLAIALDTADLGRLRSLAKTLGPRVGFLKIGLEAFAAHGPRAIEIVAAHAPVFLDLKLHDIPNTVAGAVRSLRDQGVALLTVHCSGGREMLEAARAAAGDALGLLGVTVLTSLDRTLLRELGVVRTPKNQAGRLASLAQAAGLRGIVCSPQEVAALRRLLPPPWLLVTPGIRPEGAPRDDQRRTATPSAALAAGADLLVIGRPVAAAPDPPAALDCILAALEAR